MQAVLYTLVFPVLPYILWRSYNKERKVKAGEIILRYFFYLITVSFICAVILAVLSDADTSFLEKMDKSASFALKYAVMELGAALVTAWGEWSFLKKKYLIKVDWDGFGAWKPILVCKKYICPVLPYLLALFVICLNVSLIFDNVVWGDEAFSVGTAKNSLYGVMQIMYYWDSHPPLYYFWLKLWGDLFGFSIPVCHLASVVPFGIGIVLALFWFRKKFGAVPAAFFMILSGLGTFCLGYNLEIRMYALAFLCLTACFYCSYRVISTGRKSSWIGLVLWGLAGAYSHYYALVAGGLLVFFTGAAVWIRYRGKTWRKGACAVVVLTADSGMVHRDREEGGLIKVGTPCIKNWDDKTYAVVTGLLTVAGTVAFGYFLCLVMTPVLVARYLYPVSAVTVCVIVTAASRMLEILKKCGDREGLPHLPGIGRAVLVVICLVLLVMGLGNYKRYSEEVKLQDQRTRETLEIIGTPDKSTQMVTNGVKHLGWTVLGHYYPDNEIVNHDYRGGESEVFWYFCPYELSLEVLEGLEGGGLAVTDYGEHWISQYPFYLYRMEHKE